MDDDAHSGRINRRDALRKAAAVGGALWIAPAVQTVNMSKAWAAVGSDMESDPGPGPGPGPGPEPEPTMNRYTVRFDIGPRGATCSSASRSCRCLSAEPLAGGCSFANAARTGSGQWTVTVSSEGAQVVEGFSVCADHRSHGCDPGSPAGANAMTFRPHRHRGRRRRRHGIVHIEVTFVVPDGRPASV